MNSLVSDATGYKNFDINALSSCKKALKRTKNQLQLLANDPTHFNSAVELAFGSDVLVSDASTLQQEWQAGDFSRLPSIEILSSTQLWGAKGAYASANNTIYLSEDFIRLNTDNIDAISRVLTEEIGHFIDSKINLKDSPGDEGELFSNLVSGNSLSLTQLQALKTEDDTAILNLDGKAIEIEQSANYSNFITDIDQFLAKLQLALNSQVFGNNLPLLGNKLKDSTDNAVRFIDDLRDDIQNQLQLAGTLDANKILTALNSALQGVIPAPILLDATNPNDIKFTVKIAQQKSLESLLAEGVGLPGIDLSLNGNAKTDLNYDLTLKFGVNANGFYVDTSTADELKLNLVATTPNLAATGKLEFLQVSATDNGTQFNGDFNIDLKPDADGKLTPSELTSITPANLLGAKLTGNADVKFKLATSFGSSAVLPSLTSDFNLNWAFNNAIADPNQPQSFGNLPTVAFNNVQLDLGSFFNDFANPVLNNVKTVTQPLEPILNVLTQDIDLKLAKFNLLDIAEAQGVIDQADKNFIASLAELPQLINSIPNSSSLKINMGSFDLGTVDVRTPTFDLSNINPNITATAPSLNTQLAADSQAKTFITKVNSIPGAGLEFPILKQPSQVFNVLLGKNADLFTYQTPQFNFNFTYGQSFPIIPPLFGKIEATVGAGMGLKFGYDTQGLKDFDTSGNSSDVFNGFFVDPAATSVNLNAALNILGKIDVGLASGAAGGGIEGLIRFNPKDPNNDGKLRYDEFSTLIQDPITMFNTSGQLTAGLSAYIKLGVDLGPIGPDLSYTKRFNSPRLTLLDFNQNSKSATQPPKLTLATNNNGVLRLNMGPNAPARKIINVVDGAEQFVVGGNSNQVFVSAFGSTQTYKNISKIVANGGQKDDVIELQSSLTIPGELLGGAGQDQLYGGSAKDTLWGGADWDILVGGGGADQLFGEAGEDWLIGGPGADTLNGGDGFDLASYLTASKGVLINLTTGQRTGEASGDIYESIEQIEGSSYADTLFGSADHDVFSGAEGNDSISGQGGDDLLEPGLGYDTVNGSSGTDTLVVDYSERESPVYMYGLNYKTFDPSAGKGILEGYYNGDQVKFSGIEQFNITASQGDDQLLGLNQNDTLNGSKGNDNIEGNGGNDSLVGGDGNDTLVHGSGIDTVDGGAGTDILQDANFSSLNTKQVFNDTSTHAEIVLPNGSRFKGIELFDNLSTGNGNDQIIYSTNPDLPQASRSNLINTGSGSDLINSGLGYDTVNGSSGTDTLVVDYSERESPVYMYGLNYKTFDPSAGKGILEGYYNGDQVKFSGIEQFNITASQGDDQLLGLNQNDTLNGSKGNDNIEGNGGNDSLVGGDGGDTLIGGTGKDILNGGAGNDRLIGIKPDAAIPGQSEVDTLIGGIDRDRFILGVPNQFYYNDNNNAVLGTTDYALIVGFTASEDFLQLTGSTTNYVLKSAPTGLPSGLGIYRKTTNQNELIAVLQGVSSLSLNSSSIIFV